MARFSVVSVFGLLSVAACSAGTISPNVIQIGGASGLTSSYITQTGLGPGACAAGAGNCVTGSLGAFQERNYDTRLFQAAVPAATPFTGYTQGSATASGDALGQFAMISDGTSGSGANTASNNFWDALNSATTMVIPIGISNVSDVWTMLNNVYGLNGASETSVEFDFGTSSNAATFNNVVVVNLQNAGQGGSAPSGQIRSSVDCSTVNCGANNLANGLLALSSTPVTTLNSATSTLTVTTANLFTAAYSSISAGTYAGSSGNVNLDAQDFLLGSIIAPSANEFLVQMKVTESSGANAVSQTALSAITVDTVPEPSTVFLFLTGLGAIGLSRFRRK